MKVIFLDVDGVLNYMGSKSYYADVYFVEKEKLRLLAELVNATDAEIVLSSTWRRGFRDLCEGTESFDADLYQALEDALEEFDLHIYDCTGPSLATRGEEIEAWIQKKGESTESFVILDDMGAEQFGVHADCLVQTDYRTGLEKEHVELAIRMLMENDLI